MPHFENQIVWDRFRNGDKTSNGLRGGHLKEGALLCWCFPRASDEGCNGQIRKVMETALLRMCRIVRIYVLVGIYSKFRYLIVSIQG